MENIQSRKGEGSESNALFSGDVTRKRRNSSDILSTPFKSSHNTVVELRCGHRYSA